jgi:modulator of FtsH protease HflC
LRTLEVYGEKANKNSVLILTTDSDFYRYLKQATPEGEQPLPTLAPRVSTP